MDKNTIMSDACNVEQNVIIEEPKITDIGASTSCSQTKGDDDIIMDRFQTRLHERRKQSIMTSRTFKDMITGMWLERKCYDSPFPRRESNSYASWFVDGEDFMEHAANMISLAKEEIFITDWWLSPQVYLKRPASERKWRFDELLKCKAEDGVKIYIQLFKELEMALGTIKSLESKRTMHKLHPNIKLPPRFIVKCDSDLFRPDKVDIGGDVLLKIA